MEKFKDNSRLIDDITKKDFENFSKALINQNNQKNVSTPISSTVVKIPFQILKELNLDLV